MRWGREVGAFLQPARESCCRRAGVLAVAALALTLASALPAGAAQQPPQQDYTVLLMSPQRWVNELGTLLEQVQLRPQVLRLSWALVGLGVVYGGVRVALGGLGEAHGLFARLVGATLLLALATTPAGDLPSWAGTVRADEPILDAAIKGTWESAYDWGRKRALEPVVHKVVDAAFDAAVMAAPLAAGARVLKVGGAQIAESLAASGPKATKALEFGGKAGSWLAGLSEQFLMHVAGVQMAWMALFYDVLVVMSAATVLIGLALVPLTGAALIWPGGTGAMWLGVWVRSQLAAVLTAFLLPVMFAGALKLTVELPMGVLANTMDQALQNLTQASGSTAQRYEQLIQTYKNNSDQGWWERIAGSIADSLKGVWMAVAQSFDAVRTVLFGLLATILAGFAAVLAGSFLILRLESIVSGFVGGLAGAAAHAPGLHLRWPHWGGAGLSGFSTAPAGAGGGASGAGAVNPEVLWPSGGARTSPAGGLYGRTVDAPFWHVEGGGAPPPPRPMLGAPPPPPVPSAPFPVR